MKPVGFISTGVLLFILGITGPTYAQQDEHGRDDKAPKQEQQTKPERQKQEAKPATQEHQQEGKGQPEQRQQQTRSTDQEHQQQAKNEQKQTKSNNQQQTRSAKQEERQPAKGQQARQRGQQVQRSAAEQQRQRAEPELRLSARGSGRIPDDRFRSNFGSDHRFRIGNPQMVGGFSRFQYGGYWFGFVQPWPAGWYYTDDVYVGYVGGGYYLYDPLYPGARVAISVVVG